MERPDELHLEIASHPGERPLVRHVAATQSDAFEMADDLAGTSTGTTTSTSRVAVIATDAPPLASATSSAAGPTTTS